MTFLEPWFTKVDEQWMVGGDPKVLVAACEAGEPIEVRKADGSLARVLLVGQVLIEDGRGVARFVNERLPPEGQL